MIYVIASILALGLGPLLHRVARNKPGGLAFVDGFIVVATAGLVLLLVIPEAVADAGWWALAWGAVGLLGPAFLERLFRGAARQTHVATLILALLGLAFHALLDGAALDPAVTGSVLPLAVILHRFPVGLTVWTLVRPAGTAAASAVLGLMVVATTVGFLIGPQMLVAIDGRALGWFEALVAGSLLHVVLHRHPTPHRSHEISRRYDGVGTLIGVVFVAVVLGRELALHGGPIAQEILRTFLSLALDSAAPLLLAYLMAGAVTMFLGPSSLRWMSRGGPGKQALRGMLVGLPFPVCSCGVVPLYQAFVRRGVPATAAMAFLVATPELGLDAVLLSVPLLGVPMTILRVISAATVALLIGWLVGRGVSRSKAAGVDCGCEPLGNGAAENETDTPFSNKVRASFRWGFGEVVDQTASWILLGLIVASLIQPFLDLQSLRSLPGGLEVVVFALLGLPTYVCASGATPLVAVMIAAGASPGAALAFLLTGPATNLTTFGVLSRLHGVRVAVTFALSVTGAAVALGYLANWFVPWAARGPLDPSTADSASPLQWLCLFILGAIYVVSMLRLGARRFFYESLLPEPHVRHAHDHTG